MDSGLAADDQYNLYSKPLFAERGSNLYRPNKAQDDEAHGGEGADDKDVHSERFKPTKVRQPGPACIHVKAPSFDYRRAPSLVHLTPVGVCPQRASPPRSGMGCFVRMRQPSAYPVGSMHECA